jgi:acyl-CoA thioester hydrolase
MYSKTYDLRWADLDANGHMRSTAYSEYAAEARFGLLRDNRFTPQRFARDKFGPVLFSEVSRYLKEVNPGDAITVTVQGSGMSPDGARWRIQHDIYRSDGQKAAVVVVEGAWLNLETRKLIVPPSDLYEVMVAQVRTEDYEELASPMK